MKGSLARLPCLLHLLHLLFLLLAPTFVRADSAAIALAALPFEASAVVPPLLVLAIDTEDSAALQSSWPQSYQAALDYEGYFHHGLCYRYRDPVFVPAGPADAAHYCDGTAWSGNFLNWASMSALDTLRYGLTGGERVTDESRLTVLARADLGSRAATGLAKTLFNPEADIARLTPLTANSLAIRSCGTRLQLWSSATASACGTGPAAGLLADLSLRVRVCSDDLDQRPLCQLYGKHRKPEGLLQASSSWLRLALQLPGWKFQGGALMGASELASDWTRRDNAQPQWDAKTGVLTTGFSPLRRVSQSPLVANGAASDAELLRRAMQCEPALMLASCQRNHALRWPASLSPATDGQQQLMALRRYFAGMMLDHQLAALPQSISLALARERSLFLAETEPADLSSTLRRIEVELKDSGQLLLPGGALWQASVAAASERRIFTNREDGSLIALTPGNLTASQLDGLRKSPYSIRLDTLELARLNWLRADMAEQERNGGKLANRRSPFASQLAGNLAYLESAPGKAGGLLLMASGEGMLHAIDAASGREQFAWMPAHLLQRLPLVSAPAYPALSLLDGGIGVAALARPGKSVPLLTMAGGHSARAVFALEIPDASDPEAGSWRALEFTALHDERLGHVLHAPHVVRIATRRGNASVLRPFLLSVAGVNTAAGLFLLALDHAPGSPWVEGSNYFHIAAAIGTQAGTDLAAPALVLGEDQRLLHAWAGDGQGHLWRFSFEEDSKEAAGFRAEASLVFQAQSGKAELQPISSAPRIAYANDGAYQVLFGTGRWLEFNDAAPGAARQESFYGVLDRLGSGATLKRSELAVRRVEAVDGGFRIGGDPLPADSPGWVFDFPEKGERVTQSALLINGRIMVNTRISPSDPCQPLRQRSWDFDAVQGSNAILAGRSVTQVLPAPLLLNVNAAAAPDAFGQRSAGSSAVFLDLPATGKSVDGMLVRSAQPAGRLAWREIANWSRLHEAAQSKP